MGAMSTCFIALVNVAASKFQNRQVFALRAKKQRAFCLRGRYSTANYWQLRHFRHSAVMLSRENIACERLGGLAYYMAIMASHNVMNDSVAVCSLGRAPNEAWRIEENHVAACSSREIAARKNRRPGRAIICAARRALGDIDPAL